MPPRSARALVAGLGLGLLLVTLVFTLLIPHLWYGPHAMSDVWSDQHDATQVSDGAMPYRDFTFVYPPLALPLLLAPAHAGDATTHLATYQRWFSVEMYVVTLATTAVLVVTAWLLWPGRPSRAWQAAVSSVAFVAATGALVENRFDVGVALVVALVLLALLRRWYVAAGLLVGMGFALKLAPLALLPLVLVLAAADGRRTALRAAVATGIAALLPYLPFLVVAPRGVASSFGYHAARPVQIESVPAIPLLLWHKLAGSAMTIHYTYGSHNIFGPGAKLATGAAEPLTLVAFGVACWLAWRARAALRAAPAALPAALPTAAMALLLAVTAFAKVLSPQYLIWLLPLGALLLLADWPLGLLALGATLVTQIEFPSLYTSLVHLETAGILVTAARDTLLLATFGLALARLWRMGSDGPATARGLGPVRVGPAQTEPREAQASVGDALPRVPDEPAVAPPGA